MPRFDGVKITPISYQAGSSVKVGSTQLITTTGSSSGVTVTASSLELTTGSSGYSNADVTISAAQTTVQFTYNYAPITILSD